MGLLSTESDDTSDENQPNESDDGPLFEGETLRISPQYLRRYFERRAERRGHE